MSNISSSFSHRKDAKALDLEAGSNLSVIGKTARGWLAVSSPWRSCRWAFCHERPSFDGREGVQV
jgi:hypothetical protein